MTVSEYLNEHSAHEGGEEQNICAYCGEPITPYEDHYTNFSRYYHADCFADFIDDMDTRELANALGYFKTF